MKNHYLKKSLNLCLFVLFVFGTFFLAYGISHIATGFVPFDPHFRLIILTWLLLLYFLGSKLSGAILYKIKLFRLFVLLSSSGLRKYILFTFILILCGSLLINFFDN